MWIGSNSDSVSQRAPGATKQMLRQRTFAGRHFVAIVISGLVVAAMLVGAAEFLPPRFAAQSQLLVDPRDLRVLDKEVNPRQVASDSGIALVASQAEVLVSETILSRVVADLKLADHPDFGGVSHSLLSPWLALVWPTTDEKPEGRSIALYRLRQQCGARRIERSFIIELSCYATNKELAVSLASTIVAKYIEDQVGHRSEMNSMTAEALDASLTTLRAKLSESETQAAAFRSKNDLVTSGGKLIGEQQLNDVNNQLSIASAEEARARSRYDEMKRSMSNPDTLPEAVLSPALRGLRARLAEVAAQRASLATQLLPRHPTMEAISQQERELRSQVAQELQRVLAGARHELDRASATVTALNGQLESLRGRMNSANKAQITLRALERELEANKSLYEEAALRAREARQQSSLNTVNVRVISAAEPLPFRSFPPRRTVVGVVGFTLGALLALALVLYFALRPEEEQDPSQALLHARI